MVKRLKLNEKALREAEPKPGVSYQIFDTEVIGFAARVHASGARTFTIDYRHAGRQRRMTIGRWPEWSVTAARERAKELRRAIDEGQDPLAVREDFRETPRIKDMIDRYIKEHLPKLAKTNAGDQVSMLKKMLEPAWGNKLVTEVIGTGISVNVTLIFSVDRYLEVVDAYLSGLELAAAGGHGAGGRGGRCAHKAIDARGLSGAGRAGAGGAAGAVRNGQPAHS